MVLAGQHGEDHAALARINLETSELVFSQKYDEATDILSVDVGAQIVALATLKTEAS